MRKKQIHPQKKVKGRNKSAYTNEVMLMAYNEVKKGHPIKTTARKYGIPAQTLRDRVIGLVDLDNCAPGPDTLLSFKEEEILVEHVLTLAELGYGYTNVQLQHLGGELAFQFGHKKTQKALSNCWLYGFLGRWKHKLTSLNPRSLESCRAKSATPEQISSYYDNLSEILQKYDLKDKPTHIFNLDETGLQPYHKPPNIIAAPNSKPQAIVSPKSTTVTLIGCANAIGNSLPPYFVFKGKRWNPDLMKGASPGARGVLSDSGWSNSTIFHKYLEEHFLPYVRFSTDTSQPLLLLYDGHSSHISTSLIDWAKEKNLILFVLPPHTSHLQQPLDVGIYGPFKSYYHAECSMFMKKNMGEVVTRYNMCEIGCKAYLKAMTPTNIQTAFRKTGIYPYSRKVVSADKLYPAEVFREEQPVKKVTAMKINREEVNKFLVEKSEKKTQKSENQNQNSQSICTVSATSRPRAGGLAITEDSYHNKLVQYELEKSTLSNLKKIKNNSKKSAKRPIRSSPKPSTSGIQSKNLAVHQPSDTSDTEMDDTSSSDACCVCKLHSPEGLRDYPYLIIVKWVKCDNPGCTHWVHVKFCMKESAIRRHSTFLCPHCSE